jgi:predicted DCC family thiol-disulfide oxidoreductase YuxK
VQPEPPFFLYDGECGFCLRWTRWLERKVGPGTEFVPYQSVPDLKHLGLRVEDVRSASYWVDEDHVTHRGHSAFVHVLRRGTGRWRAVAATLELPVMRKLAAGTYAVVARNRHRLPAPR